MQTMLIASNRDEDRNAALSTADFYLMGPIR